MGLTVDRISSHEVRFLHLFKTQPERWLTDAEVFGSPAKETSIQPMASPIEAIGQWPWPLGFCA
jgi:hypothetical protein